MGIAEILQLAAPYAGAIIGQVGHMVKKKQESKSDVGEVEIIKNMIVKKPLNTFAAIATTIVAVVQLVAPESSSIHQFLQAFAVAWASDSMVNKAG